MKHLQMILQLLLLCKIISSGGELIYFDNTLEGSGMTNFPNGEYENVQIINFHDNDFNELKSSVFEEHKFFNVNTASIRHSNIRYIHPYAFAKMSNLLDLSLYGNNLTIFHKDTFAGLESLQYLDLGHNQIRRIDALILKRLQSLITLDLSYNRLRSVASHFIKHSSVSELELSGNSLQFAAEGPIFSSHRLTRLVMSFCNITELPSDAFVELRQIRSLDLSNNKLEVLPKDILKPLVYLEYFDVSYNSIRHLDAEMLLSPTNFNILLCDENHSELTFSCEDFMKDLESKRNHHAIEATGQNTTNVKTEGNRTDEVFQLEKPNQKTTNVETQENRADEVFQLVIVLCIVCICLLAVGVILYMFWQRRGYSQTSKSFI